MVFLGPFTLSAPCAHLSKLKGPLRGVSSHISLIFPSQRTFYHPVRALAKNIKLLGVVATLTWALSTLVSAIVPPGTSTPLFYLAATAPDSAGVKFLVSAFCPLALLY